MNEMEDEKEKVYLRKDFVSNRGENVLGDLAKSSARGGELSYQDYMDQEAKQDTENELIRSVMRIQQSREEPLDNFVKIVYTYKGVCHFDPKILEIMKEPQRYLERLSAPQLETMQKIATSFSRTDIFKKDNFTEYWENLISLIDFRISGKKKSRVLDLKPEYEERIKVILSKPLESLLTLRGKIRLMLKNPSFRTDEGYWEHIIKRINVKQSESRLFEYFQRYKEDNYEALKETEVIEDEKDEQPTSPLLRSIIGINPKLITTEEEERNGRHKLAEKIFKEEFEKGKEKLEINLSLPKNHGLLSTDIITEETNTYDQITREIIEFEKYKRLEEDEEEFNDWVPTDTEGRFRDRKPVYLNRVRVSCQWNKYNQNHFTDDNPPPKTIQGYKFNIFYPDLYDKQKTPQYYLQAMDNPDYCVIKFKAGPPYKDIAFKILRKEWDFSEKSGFESIFAKGILHLYFNFKKPKFRI